MQNFMHPKRRGVAGSGTWSLIEATLSGCAKSPYDFKYEGESPVRLKSCRILSSGALVQGIVSATEFVLVAEMRFRHLDAVNIIV